MGNIEHSEHQRRTAMSEAELASVRQQLRGAVPTWRERVADAAQVCAELASAADAADDDESARILKAALGVLDRQTGGAVGIAAPHGSPHEMRLDKR